MLKMMKRLFLLATALVLHVDGIKDVKKQLVFGAPGVCKKDITVPTTKVTYPYVLETYKDPKCNYCVQKRKTKKKKILKINVKKSINLCCEGWKYNEPLNKCEPLCQPDCVNGTCVGPDSCECFQGLRHVANNVCSEPECSPPCQQGTCVFPGVCKCNEGYNNSPEHSSICEPECPNSCVNGYCIAPGVCTCDEGFVMQNGVCEEATMCETPCINAECVGHNKCACLDGYTRLDDSSCKPICQNSCSNGECIRPDICACFVGYIETNVSYICEPSCQKPCARGKCVAPDLCECDPGYDQDEEDPYSCKPHCDELCEYGVCVSPQKCQCFVGYKFEEHKGTCVPSCLRPCINGECSAPDTCSCKEGFEMDAEDKFSCNPKCSRACINADCAVHDTCVCHEGYQPVDEYMCEPTCDECNNGKCIQPNICECNEGYEKDFQNLCSPKCDFDCHNAECMAPNTCVCLPGYKKDNVTSCSPECPHCGNGVCVSPGICTCDVGYVSEDGVCVPDCQNSCSNGICEAPGVCKCDASFKLINGTCRPNCEGCLNGHCIEPNLCVCPEGYFLKDGDCHQLCTKKLVNALCVDRESYKCMEGFLKRKTNDDLFECYSTESLCESYCHNGTCNDEGICVCSMEFSGTYCNFTNHVILKQDIDIIVRSDNCTDCDKLAESFTISKSEMPWTWLWVAIGLLILCVLIGLAERVSRRFSTKKKDTDSNFTNTEQLYASVLVSKPNTLVASDPLPEEENGSDEVTPYTTLQATSAVGGEAKNIVYHELDELCASSNHKTPDTDLDSIEPVTHTSVPNDEEVV